MNVAYSCALLDDEMTQFNLTGHTSVESCSAAILSFQSTIEAKLSGSQVCPGSCQFALIVDGRTLFLAMKHLKHQFRKVCMQCSAVVCCRMSPIQKAEVRRIFAPFRSTNACFLSPVGCQNDQNLRQTAGNSSNR